MAILKKTGEVYALETENTFLDNFVGGLKAPILKTDQYLDSDSAFWASVSYGLIGSAVGGYVARKRTEAGKPAMAGLLF